MYSSSSLYDIIPGDCRYSGYVYDAVWLYALVMDHIIRTDKTLVQVHSPPETPWCHVLKASLRWLSVFPHRWTKIAYQHCNYFFSSYYRQHTFLTKTVYYSRRLAIAPCPPCPISWKPYLAACHQAWVRPTTLLSCRVAKNYLTDPV